jgi:valyl-tRNA synthetase
MEIPKAYSPQETEDKILALWEKSGFSNPDTCVKKGFTKKTAKPFSIVLPPPNVTGTLHMGHAAMLAIEDILIRFHRMRGRKTLWLPGTDHAAIATESKVEQTLYKTEGKTRHELGRPEFLRRVEQFAKESHDTILRQIKKIGASLDWSREAYTLDQERNLAVRTAFIRMYEAGLIYRGDRIVNWDPAMQTTVSDDEIEWKEETASFYYLQYGPFLIGTARPETKFGDKYVVMHPKDKRYKEYAHRQKIELEWITGPVTATVIKDEAVDMEFGTGAMTITPWHDTIDFEIAERHHVDKEQIIDLKGKLLPIAKEFAAMHIAKARRLVVQKLQEKGLVKKIDENYAHRIATNSRGGGIIEPQIMRQWFVDVNKSFAFPHAGLKSVQKGESITLKDLMARVVEKKEIAILPKRFEKIYFHWIKNLRDWCISRQIWFGHQIPVWYHLQADDDREVYVGVNPPPGKGWAQDTDTLDTWFSSGLWTFSTLGWPQKTDDLTTYHPTSVLETGYDILFFWVARMILRRQGAGLPELCE